MVMVLATTQMHSRTMQQNQWTRWRWCGDNADAFPNDATETVDSDGDGVGDNADAFPNDGNRSADSMEMALTIRSMIVPTVQRRMSSMRLDVRPNRFRWRWSRRHIRPVS